MKDGSGVTVPFFYDRLKWPQHHGVDEHAEPERLIKPTKEEEKDGVLLTGVVFTYCRERDHEGLCGRYRIWYRHHYIGGPGPISEAKSGKKRVELKRRLKEPIESHWVWGYHPETFVKVKRMVR